MNHQEKFHFRNISAQNRIVIPPMASGTATKTGYVTEKTLEHYARLSAASPGIHFVEYSYVDPSGRSETNQLGIQSDDHIPGLQRLVEVISSSGALPGIQITHAGGKSSWTLTENNMSSASAVPVPTVRGTLPVPNVIPISDIEDFQRGFVDSSVRAAQAGFKIVELHAAHGYGLNQWLSPITNRRQDRYGGSPENRMRMVIEIVGKIRQRLPSLLLAVRMPGQDLIEGGLTVKNMQNLALALEANGVDLLDVSSGLGGWRRPKERRGQGYLLPEAKSIQEVSSLPVIGVGGIQELSYVDAALRNGEISFAAIGRAFLENPLRFAS